MIAYVRQKRNPLRLYADFLDLRIGLRESGQLEQCPSICSPYQNVNLDGIAFSFGAEFQDTATVRLFQFYFKLFYQPALLVIPVFNFYFVYILYNMGYLALAP